jgi:hypothetical protein
LCNIYANLKPLFHFGKPICVFFTLIAKSG